MLLFTMLATQQFAAASIACSDDTERPQRASARHCLTRYCAIAAVSSKGVIDRIDGRVLRPPMSPLTTVSPEPQSWVTTVTMLACAYSNHHLARGVTYQIFRAAFKFSAGWFLPSRSRKKKLHGICWFPIPAATNPD